MCLPTLEFAIHNAAVVGLINVLFVLMEFIETCLVVYPCENENSSGHPDSKSGDVDERETLRLEQIPERDCNIIFNHKSESIARVTKVRPGFEAK